VTFLKESNESSDALKAALGISPENLEKTDKEKEGNEEVEENKGEVSKEEGEISLEEGEISKEGEKTVIIIDDTIEDIEEDVDDDNDDDDELEIIGEVPGSAAWKMAAKPMTMSNIQDVTSRYQSKKSDEFIGFTIDTRPEPQPGDPIRNMYQQPQRDPIKNMYQQQIRKNWKEMRKSSRGRGGRGSQWKHANINTRPLPSFQPDQPPNTNFTDKLSTGPSVFKFSGFQGRGGTKQGKGQSKLKSPSKSKTQKRIEENRKSKELAAEEEQVKKPKEPETPSGPTMFVPESAETDKKGLRPIVIDGSNVAMAHGKHTDFSVRGIEICIQYFKKRGHTSIIAFVPQHRMYANPDLLRQLEKDGNVAMTPSRKVGDKRISSYDDRFIVEYANEHGGIIVSRDNYRDLLEEKPEWRKTIEERLLMPTWVGDSLMFPSDPLGSDGPSLDKFLKFDS